MSDVRRMAAIMGALSMVERENTNAFYEAKSYNSSVEPKKASKARKNKAQKKARMQNRKRK